MIDVESNNRKLVIAGPGTGKTHGMVEEIAKNLPRLKPNRFLVAITYTNAATEEIKKRLLRSFSLPPNLFIGTIHRFLNRFILTPYAATYDVAPQETIFIDTVNLPYDIKNKFAKKAEKIKLASQLAECGVFCHDKTIEMAFNLVQEKKIANALSNRFQMIFVDEYQDATALQEGVFAEIGKCGKTELLYFVGDPEQYIFSFRYSHSLIKGEKAPSFRDIPIMKLKDELGEAVSSKFTNKRSKQAVVSFLNNFNTQTSQNAENAEGGRVVFINGLELKKIVEKFQELCEQAFDNNKSIKIFYLSHYKRTLEPIAAELNLTPITNERVYSNNQLLSECIGYVSGMTGKSQRQIMNEMGLDCIEWRKIGINALKKVISEPTITKEEFDSYLESEFGLKKDSEKNCEGSFERLKVACAKPNQNCANKQYSTIHKSKGLEADAVLVVCEKKKKLNKWLEHDEKVRFECNDDGCRLGFVAFSRAKDLLCIACLEDISGDQALKKLESYNVEIKN